MIPMEIALKIASKIRAHERFAAYIIIPMWPEGNPTGAATQRILFWQVGSTYDLNSYIIVCDTFLFLREAMEMDDFFWVLE